MCTQARQFGAIRRVLASSRFDRPPAYRATVGKAQLPIAEVPQVIEALRNWYCHQERVRFELLALSMVVTGASHGADDVRQKIVFRPSVGVWGVSPQRASGVGAVSPGRNVPA